MAEITLEQATSIVDARKALEAARKAIRDLQIADDVQVSIYGSPRNGPSISVSFRATPNGSSTACNVVAAIRQNWEQKRDAAIRRLHQLGAEIPPEKA